MGKRVVGSGCGAKSVGGVVGGGQVGGAGQAISSVRYGEQAGGVVR